LQIFGKSFANLWQIWQTLIYGQTANNQEANVLANVLANVWWPVVSVGGGLMF
jgi:hypothetical protein